LLTLEFFLLEGFESNKLGDGGKFGIDKLWLNLRIKRHND
jgi:hypothetical protein